MLTPPTPLTRREMLARSGGGFGAVALAGMLADDARASGTGAPRPHAAATADSVIFLFMEGGPSHLDTFDPKPKLNRLAGRPMPPGYKRVVTPMGVNDAPLLASKRKWSRHGESGLTVSDWLPHTARHADEMCVIRSCWTDGINHSGGVCQMNTGSPVAGRPSLGAWVSYGLGTENRDLPGFVVLLDNKTPPTNGARNWSSGFMPAGYQASKLSSGPEPIAHLASPKGVTRQVRRETLDLLASLNSNHAAARPRQTELDARLASYELAYRMQSAAPEAVDLAAETDETKALYGLDAKETESFGRNCLLARRLVERGTRFVQLYSGSGSKWDAHSQIESNHDRMCRSQDKPVAGLLTDLKRRGLLDRTLVVWGGEFGRTPMSEGGTGRDHNPSGFTMWMAGGGVRGGRVIGSTDDLGFHAVENRLHVHDLHATILHALGVDHELLTYTHQGRPERATQNEGRVCDAVFA